MTTSIAFAQEAWDSLRSALEANLETAWILVARRVVVSGSSDVSLLVREIINIPEESYLSRTDDRLSIATSGWLHAFARAQRDESVPIFVHTHPNGFRDHSELDLQLDDELARVASVRTGAGFYGSLVLSGTVDTPVFVGRLKSPAQDWEPIDRLRVVGQRLTILTSTAEEAPLPVFDRQVRAFGADGQRVLRQLRVGVVGAGGTGSAVIEQLIRLGIGSVVLIDPETLDETNVTRVYGSGLSDVDAPKVEVAKSNAGRIGLGTDVDARRGTVVDRPVSEALVHCDVVMGCTDDNAGRVVLTRFPHTMLQLLIDCGVVIDSREGVLFDIFARVSVVTPTTACLVCMGDVNLEAARSETLNEEERRGLAAEGYASELNTNAPSVVTFTTLAASLAVNELLSRVLGYCEDDPANRIVARIGNRSISRNRRPVRGTHRCGNIDSLAAGMQEPFLDYGWTNAG